VIEYQVSAFKTEDSTYSKMCSRYPTCAACMDNKLIDVE